MAKATFDPEAPLEALYAIAVQVQKNAAVDKAIRAKAAQWTSFATRVQEALSGQTGETTRIEEAQTYFMARQEAGLTEEEAKAAYDFAQRMAVVLNPQAEQWWTVEDVEKHLRAVKTFDDYGAYGNEADGDRDERLALALEVGEALQPKVTRTKAAVIEGRPSRIDVWDLQNLTDGVPTLVTNQAGNTANSAGNISRTIWNYMQLRGSPLDDDAKKALAEQVLQVCKGEVPTAVLLDGYLQVEPVAQEPEPATA